MAAKTTKPQPQKAAETTIEDAASIHISLSQMLDLALGTPEVGTVNLNILHNFLHILLHQFNLRTTKVEYRGNDANRIKTMVTSFKSGPKLHLHEYSITDSSGKVRHRIHSTDQLTVTVDVFAEEKGGKTPETAASAPVSARGAKEKDAERPSKELEPPKEGKGDVATRKTKGTKQQVGPGANGECQNVIFVEPIVDGTIPSALAFKQLENTVYQLDQRFHALEELSTNPELVERLKGNVMDPLTDMWHIININKRLDASEQGINKLTSMVQDVIKGDVGVDTEDSLQMNQRLMKLENDMTNVRETIWNLNNIIEGEQEIEMPKVETTEEEVQGVNVEIEVEHPAVRRSTATKNSLNVTEIHGDVNLLKTEMAQMRKDVYDLKTKVDQSITAKPVIEELTDVSPGDEKKDSIAGEWIEKVQNVEMAQETLHGRVNVLESELQTVMEKAKPSASIGADDELSELVSKIQNIQADMHKMNETADRLLDERENYGTHFNAMLEQIELLKTIKADKEDLEDALADKADAQIVNRKVSHDQFNAACDDLTRGLEDAINKLGQQESIWQQALDEVQKDIEGKVDKIEISPLREFVNNRLKNLQDKVKTMMEMKRETEAAGTKKLLRDVQCISCDKNVVMKTEETSKYQSDPMPCNMSMKPYLSYELDQVRKQQRRLPHSRNMIQFEAALMEESRKIKSAREEQLVRTPKDHLCNRYCGGSHTTTTPQQRVMRVGHFLAQWGPQALQLTEGLIRGTDGQMYRSRQIVGKSDVCCLSKLDSSGPPSKHDMEQQSIVGPKKLSQIGQSLPRRQISKKLSAENDIKETAITHEPKIDKLDSQNFEADHMPIDPFAHTDVFVQQAEKSQQKIAHKGT